MQITKVQVSSILRPNDGNKDVHDIQSPNGLSVQCLYDFAGDTHNGELMFFAGDILTVVRQDVGEGWWEAKNASGVIGLIPETYVTVISMPEPSFPPPSAPPISAMPHDIPHTQNGYNNSSGMGSVAVGGGVSCQDNCEDWDDEWDDDQSSSSTVENSGTQALAGAGNFGLHSVRRNHKESTDCGRDFSRYGTVKKSFNRFSNFSKLGGDAFLMGQVESNVPESDQIMICDSEDGPRWYSQDLPYTCSVASPKKASKMKGLKSFISYQLTPMFSNIQVSRRYKHFDWVHERLEEKFPCIPIPPLPDKQVTGRYEEDFVQERMKFLQMWVDRLVRHPVIRRSDVFLHFLTCTDEKSWKHGKRRAERDDYLGGKFFLTLTTPRTCLDMHDVDSKMEQFQRFVSNMSDGFKQIHGIMQAYAKKQTGPFKREYTKIGMSLKQLALTFNMDTTEASRHLTSAVDHTGDAFNEIGTAFERQPSSDIFPLMDSLLEYRGILGVYHYVLKVHEGAIGKAKECLRLKEEGKMPESEVRSVLRRADTISYGTLAEMNHFQTERVKDIRLMMQLFLRSQVNFYQEITKKLELALDYYDDV